MHPDMSKVCQACILLMVTWTTVYASDHERHLVDKLFNSKGPRAYNKLIRPARNITDKIIVKFEAALIQIISVVSSRMADLRCVLQGFPSLV